MFDDKWRCLTMFDDIWRCLTIYGDKWWCLTWNGVRMRSIKSRILVNINISWHHIGNFTFVYMVQQHYVIQASLNSSLVPRQSHFVLKQYPLFWKYYSIPSKPFVLRYQHYDIIGPFYSTVIFEKHPSFREQ